MASTVTAPSIALAAWAALALAGPTAAQAAGPTAVRAAGPTPAVLTVVASDATGMTLRYAAPEYRLVPVDRPEGRFFRVDAPALTGSTEREGHPLFPAAGGLVAVPPGTEPIVRIVDQSVVPVTPADGREPVNVGMWVLLG